MTTLTREALKASSEPQYFDVSSNGMTGRARKLKHSQLAEYEAWLFPDSPDEQARRQAMQRERLLGMCLVNEDGSPMYSGDEWKELAECDAVMVKDLFNQVYAGCGFKDYSEAKSVKNSDGD